MQNALKFNSAHVNKLAAIMEIGSKYKFNFDFKVGDGYVYAYEAPAWYISDVPKYVARDAAIAGMVNEVATVIGDAVQVTQLVNCIVEWIGTSTRVAHTMRDIEHLDEYFWEVLEGYTEWENLLDENAKTVLNIVVHTKRDANVIEQRVEQYGKHVQVDKQFDDNTEEVELFGQVREMVTNALGENEFICTSATLKRGVEFVQCNGMVANFTVDNATFENWKGFAKRGLAGFAYWEQ